MEAQSEVPQKVLDSAEDVRTYREALTFNQLAILTRQSYGIISNIFFNNTGSESPTAKDLGLTLCKMKHPNRDQIVHGVLKTVSLGDYMYDKAMEQLNDENIPTSKFNSEPVAEEVTPTSNEIVIKVLVEGGNVKVTQG